jgi:hypothetical protein
MEIAASPEAMIDLTWRQKIAAFWSIAWPTWLASFVLLGFLIGHVSINSTEGRLRLSLLGNAAYFVGQALLFPRLVRKRYRSFQIFVVRHDQPPSRSLSPSEILHIWFQVAGPQVVFLAGTFAALSLEIWNVSPETLQRFSSLGIWVSIFIVGPSAIGFAMRRRYQGFRLQAYGWRLI